MHELSLAYSLVEMAEEHLTKSEGEKINSITLAIGLHSGVVRSAMEFAFPEAVKDRAVWSECDLIINEIPVKMFCTDCNDNQYPKVEMMICPKCLGSNIEILEGKDFFLQSMEVE